MIAHFLVKCHRSGVFLGNQGIKHLIALKPENFLQRGIELSADAPAFGLGSQVYGGLRDPAVGSPGEGTGGIGVAQDLSFLLPDQPGELPGDIQEALNSLRQGTSYSKVMVVFST